LPDMGDKKGDCNRLKNKTLCSSGVKDSKRGKKVLRGGEIKDNVGGN